MPSNAPDSPGRLDADEIPRLLAAYGGWEGRTRRDGWAQVLDRLGVTW